MKIEQLFFYCLMAGTFLFFSCSKADYIADTFLLECMHLVRFTATQNDVVTSPQTRVSDYEEGGNHKNKWSNGDKIEVKSSQGCAIALTSENANVEIKGSGTNPTLTVTGGYYQAGIGGNNNSFGNIKIENITLDAYGHVAAPGIGSRLPAGQGQLKKSDWIYIKNSLVTVSSQYDSFFNVYPTAIGNSSITGGASLEQGDIIIENTFKAKQKILSTLTQLSGSHKIGNGTGGDTSRGTIKIDTITIIARDGTFTDNGQGYIDN